MAVSGSNVLVNGSATDASSYATASITPSANTLYLASFVCRNGASIDPAAPTLTGAGLTWVQVNSVLFDNSSSSRRRLTVFRAMGTGSAGALTFDLAGVTMTSADWSIDAFTGVDTSGTNGSGAIVQSATNFDPGVTATALTVTLAALGSAGNATFGAFASGQTLNTAAPGSGYTQLSNFNEGEAGSQILTEWRAAGSTTVDWTDTSTGAELGGIGIEIKAAVATATVSRLMMMGV